MKALFSLAILLFFFASCDKVEFPYPKSLDLDTTIYPGNWADYEANEWPTFTQNLNINRNVLIEDFTGHKCIYCPAAGALAEELAHSNEGRVFVAAIHTGPAGLGDFQFTSAPNYLTDFTNPQGLAIGTYFGTTITGSLFGGNPFGTISRFPVDGQNTIEPQAWENSVISLIQANNLKVNIQAKLNYYDETKGFYLHTEVQKIGTIANDLAQVVYLVEDSIIKPQLFPAPVGDSLNYVHHNVQRTCIDGNAFGRTLADTYLEGGKYYLDYSYKIPSQYNPQNMHLLVYVLDKVTNEIYQVIKVEIE